MSLLHTVKTKVLQTIPMTCHCELQKYHFQNI